VSWAGSFSRDAAPLGAWRTRSGDPSWSGRRARLMALLAEADRLTSVADLVGAGSLPGHERMVLLAGRLIREGVLQQNALSAQDAFCGEAKAVALVDLVLDVIDACEDAVMRGVPAATIEEFDLSPVVRARELVGPDDAAGLGPVRDAVLARLEQLA